MSAQPKPLVVTFLELERALFWLHMGDRMWIDRLHDVWKRGAPSPDSHVCNPVGYDERQRQPGNYEAHILSPQQLAPWIMDVSAARGFPYSLTQAVSILDGKVTG